MIRYLFLSAFCFALTVAPVAGQEESNSSDAEQVEKGFSLMQEGTRLMLQGLMERVEPALRDLGAAIDDLNAYQAPEVLPNGDILIRRKTPREPEGAVPGPGEEEEIAPGGNIDI
jgi:hypothetical protein